MSMHRTYSNQSNAALIFSKDADYNPSIIEKNSSGLFGLFLGAKLVDTDPEAGESNVEIVKEEVKESMYVVKLLEMIGTVLEYESHLFSSSELELLHQIQSVNAMQQFLIARLVQRKRGKWHRIDHLLSSYQHDLVKYLQIPEVDTPRKLAETLVGLCTNWRTQDGPVLATSDVKDVIDLTLDSDDEDEDTAPKAKSVVTDKPPTLVSSGVSSSSEPIICSFAEDTNSATPAQLLECLTLDELKLMAKRLKVARTKQTRAELVKALLHSSSTQTTLPFTVVTKPSAKTPQKDNNDMRQFFVQAPTNKMPLQERRVRDLCNEIFGACFRLRDEVFHVLRLVSLVYFRSTQYSESESILLAAILTTAQKRNYPKYEFRRTADIFKTRIDLLRYMEALQLMDEIENLLGEGPNGLPAGIKPDRLKAAQEVVERWKRTWDRWKSLVTYFQDKPLCERGLERFEEGHILTRLVYKAVHCFSLLKEYEMELKLLCALVRQKRWRRGKRGGWYDRMALIYTRYMGGGDDNLNKARDVLIEGLNDKLVHLGSRPQLLKRLRAVEKKLRIPPEEQYNGDAELKTATLTRIEGIRVFKPPFSSAQVHDTNTTPLPHAKSAAPDRKPDCHASTSSIAVDSKAHQVPWTGKSIWVGKEGEVNVETFALEYYATLGFRGFHSEGSIISTLFGLLFWDILFAPVPGAFETPYQSAPLDLFHDSFVSAREDSINARLSELVNDQSAARRIVEAVDERERENETWCIGVRWEQFGREDLLEIVDCLGGRALTTICRLLAEEYANRGGGVPDLFIWNHSEKTCKFVEVKGPGDNLSATQKVWIDVLLGAGVDVEVCRVYELGKTPALRTKKNKSQGHVASKGRVSKAKRESSDLNDGQEPDPEPQEEDELWSSSEDGDGAAASERPGTLADQLALSNDDQPPSESTHDVNCDSTRPADPEDTQPLRAPSPLPTDIGTASKREVQETEPDAHQEADRAAKRARTSKAARTPTPTGRTTPRPPASLATPKAPARAHTPATKSNPHMPAPALPSAHVEVKAEPLSPKAPSLTGSGPSLVGNERTNRDVFTQETVVPETPPPPSQSQHPADSPTSVPTSARGKKQWGQELVTPIKKRRKENDPATEAPATATVKPTPKRKRADSSTHTSAPLPPLPPFSTTTPAKSKPQGSTPKGDSIARSRTPRKRTCTSSSRGVAASPKVWEKTWPDVFPKWVGDLDDKSSDGDYEPSQPQSQSESQ
ncbi:hypothetical protein FRC07_000461 [Ceratobasidium sp. 392]|nr:hypothetical protein FRC07_000461 [Ceratobasidium sp. 392]